MKKSFVLSLGLAGLLAVGGCAGWKEKVQPQTVTENREARAAKAVRDFEERRDAAQLQAALDRWNQGDAARAEDMIGAIVSRRPDYIDARLHLAEILWARGDEGAESHLRVVLASQAELAAAHHALGMLLDATGRAEEARQHLTKAAELEPANEIYRVTCESLAGSGEQALSGGL